MQNGTDLEKLQHKKREQRQNGKKDWCLDYNKTKILQTFQTTRMFCGVNYKITFPCLQAG